MTEWSDAEISRRLALAIGWREDRKSKDGWPDPDVVIFSEDYGRKSWCAVWFESDWRTFDYRDPAVYAPIAERFDCFPSKVTCGDTTGWLVLPGTAFDVQPTAAKAVAIAVIKAKDQP